MGEKIISKCPKCGQTLCKIGKDSNVEVVCKKCNSKFEVANNNGTLHINPVEKIKHKKELTLATAE